MNELVGGVLVALAVFGEPLVGRFFIGHGARRGYRKNALPAVAVNDA
jgi:hypothetical protein